MGNTTLFAPTIDLTQPAVVMDDGGNFSLKVYFNKSAYNNWGDINKIYCTFTDPSVMSSWSNSSLLQGATFDTEYQCYVIQKDKEEENGKSYLEFTQSDVIGAKVLRNQFYQVQIYFSDAEGKKSPMSQTTLVRFIDEPTLNVNILNDKIISGVVSYTRGGVSSVPQIEAVAACEYEITQNSVVVKSKTIVLNQKAGLNFSFPINFNFDTDIDYKINIWYTTINGYRSDCSSLDYRISDPLSSVTTEWSDLIFPIKINIDTESSSFVLQNQYNEKPSWLEAGTLYLQKKNEFDKAWKTIEQFYFSSDSVPLPFYLNWRDSYVESGVEYSYRFYFENNSKEIVGKSKVFNKISTDFSNILLSTKDIMLAIQFNPQVSNYKWVTQESITNTLGGRYPIIRRNGDTKYRQFSLSGTLYFDFHKDEQVDSWNNPNRKFYMAEDDLGLYFSYEKAYPYTGSDKEAERLALNKRLRQVAMDFLTDGNLKLFRSREEGNLIVYLSNISFTPNKELGGLIYDFSATTTEVCEATEENMRKYNFKSNNNSIYSLILKVNNFNVYEKSAYINLNQLLNGNVTLNKVEVATNVL